MKTEQRYSSTERRVGKCSSFCILGNLFLVHTNSKLAFAMFEIPMPNSQLEPSSVPFIPNPILLQSFTKQTLTKPVTMSCHPSQETKPGKREEMGIETTSLTVTWLDGKCQ